MSLTQTTPIVRTRIAKVGPDRLSGRMAVLVIGGSSVLLWVAIAWAWRFFLS